MFIVIYSSSLVVVLGLFSITKSANIVYFCHQLVITDKRDAEFPIQVLEGVIKYRWNALPVEQRDGMKNYISDVIVKVT